MIFELYQDLKLYFEDRDDGFTYQRFQEMMKEKGYGKAMIYLVSYVINKHIQLFSPFGVKHIKKALKIDPKNRSLTRMIHIALDKIKKLTNKKTFMKFRKGTYRLQTYKKLHYIDLEKLWDSL